MVKILDVVTITTIGTLESSSMNLCELSPNQVLVTHPLHPKVFLVEENERLNLKPFSPVGPIEKALNFIKSYEKLFNYVDLVDYESIVLYFIVNKRISNRQKGQISTLCGIIADYIFESDIDKAIDFINFNKDSLDEFNLMWYKNFNKFFTKKELVTFKKTKTSIFNIAGFLLTELYPKGVIHV